jgi:50S ribosomal protein L16 3-hydroxylase
MVTTVRNLLPQSTLPGGMPVKVFLRDYWQKKPLLIRAAVPGFGDALDKAGLLALARRDDVESRFVSHTQSEWQLGNGPFSAAEIKRWKAPWTVLVQGVNLVLPAGDALLRHFSFIPYARLDDLMVSYATDGGGVGPHIDNYDVFLLQGSGRRRWRIGKAKRRELVAEAPLKILKHFVPDEEHVLEAGDMLYLPPDWAHDGIAEGECMTWSVGFRTSPANELAEQFLCFLQDRIADENALKGRYSDPDLQAQVHPAEIRKPMITQTMELLAQIRWDEAIVRDFLGSVLTEPKSHVFFDPPETPLPRKTFVRQAQKYGVCLDARTKMLFSGKTLYLNGEIECFAREDMPTLTRLADQRGLPAQQIVEESLIAQLYDWYDAGFLHIVKSGD